MLFQSIRTFALPTLAAAALISACGDQATPTSPAAGPAAPDLAAAPGGAALSLFGLGGPAEGCRTAPYRQFDFWLGSWTVTAGGPRSSASFVTSTLDGCAVLEEWHAANGQLGRSLNAYDRADGQWHQHWGDNQGFFPLRLDGGLVNGAMVLQESYPDPFGSGATNTDRYTWTRLPDDDVRQLAERSLDGGQTFQSVLFDGHYHRDPLPVVPTPRVFGYCHLPSLALFREFDFSLGRWQVSLDGPAEDGTGGAWARTLPLDSRITESLDGCLYEERLAGPAGYEARIFTNLRPIDEIWRRTYVDNRGLRIYLMGPRLENGRIVLTGSMPARGGGTQAVRATFEPIDADRFVERWERGDGHGGWLPLVTATYERMTNAS